MLAGNCGAPVGPGFLERLKTRTKNEAHYARSREAAADDRTRLFGADFASLRPCERLATTGTTPRHLLRRPGGDLVDPGTGEVF